MLVRAVLVLVLVAVVPVAAADHILAAGLVATPRVGSSIIDFTYVQGETYQCCGTTLVVDFHDGSYAVMSRGLDGLSADGNETGRRCFHDGRACVPFTYRVDHPADPPLVLVDGRLTVYPHVRVTFSHALPPGLQLVDWTTTGSFVDGWAGTRDITGLLGKYVPVGTQSGRLLVVVPPASAPRTVI